MDTAASSQKNCCRWVSASSVQARVIGSEAGRLHQRRLRLGRRRMTVPQRPAAQQEIVGVWIGRRLGQGPLEQLVLQRHAQGGGSGARRVVLHGEDIGDGTIVAIGPEIRAGRGLDRLGRRAGPITGVASVALDDVAGARCTADSCHVDRLSLVPELRVPSGHPAVAEPGELGGDVFGEPVGKRLVGRIGTHIGERQDGDHGSAPTAVDGQGAPGGVG